MDDIMLELQELTNKAIQGDITPVVYDLLKSTCYKADLLRYLGTVKKDEDKPAEVKPAVSFKDWFNTFEEVR